MWNDQLIGCDNLGGNDHLAFFVFFFFFLGVITLLGIDSLFG